MSIEIEKLEAVEIMETGDYREIWRAIMEAPKDGEPRTIKGSENWSVERLERVKAAIRGRYRRCSLPFVLHLQGGPYYFGFFWSAEEYEVFHDDPATAQSIKNEFQTTAEDVIRAGGFRSRPYRKSPTYQQRIQRKTLRKGIYLAEKCHSEMKQTPDETLPYTEGGQIPW